MTKKGSETDDYERRLLSKWGASPTTAHAQPSSSDEKRATPNPDSIHTERHSDQPAALRQEGVMGAAWMWMYASTVVGERGREGRGQG